MILGAFSLLVLLGLILAPSDRRRPSPEDGVCLDPTPHTG